jgi:hypothetical protein
MLEVLAARGFQVEFHSHATAILSVDFPDAVAELETAIGQMSIPIEELIGSGGGETKGTQRLRHALADLNWRKAIRSTSFQLTPNLTLVARLSFRT